MPSLRDITTADTFAARVSHLVQQVAIAPDEEAACALLWRATHLFGADACVFVSFIRDDDSYESYRFLLACDPRWCHEYLEQAWFASDPWLKHAMDHGTPSRGTEVAITNDGQRTVVDLAARYGFTSSAVIPAPSSGGMSRLGVLCVGSDAPGYFDGEGFGPFKIMARSLSMELQEWWLARIQQQLVDDSGLSADDLRLLGYEWHGMGSKQIAKALQTTQQSVDSRFQRLIGKLGVPNRKAAARMAAEYGLITTQPP
jgi:DNA-binding CsgD family transcriptional regulator